MSQHGYISNSVFNISFFWGSPLPVCILYSTVSFLKSFLNHSGWKGFSKQVPPHRVSKSAPEVKILFVVQRVAGLRFMMSRRSVQCGLNMVLGEEHTRFLCSYSFIYVLVRFMELQEPSLIMARTQPLNVGGFCRNGMLRDLGSWSTANVVHDIICPLPSAGFCCMMCVVYFGYTQTDGRW